MLWVAEVEIILPLRSYGSKCVPEISWHFQKMKVYLDGVELKSERNVYEFLFDTWSGNVTILERRSEDFFSSEETTFGGKKCIWDATATAQLDAIFLSVSVLEVKEINIARGLCGQVTGKDHVDVISFNRINVNAEYVESVITAGPLLLTLYSKKKMEWLKSTRTCLSCTTNSRVRKILMELFVFDWCFHARNAASLPSKD